MRFDFSAEELALLQRIVQQYYMNLRAEIYHTDSSLFKDTLKAEEAQIQRLLKKVGSELFETAAV
ncbi:MAG: hypothetical protein ALAOOOJD_02278 [bacterium]|nr:hypothetical protein [bacterium]